MLLLPQQRIPHAEKRLGSRAFHFIDQTVIAVKKMPGRRVVIDHLNQPIPRVVAVLANGSINRQRYLCETTQAVITQRPTGSIQNQMPIGVIAQCNRRWIVRMRVLNLDQLRRITLAHGVGRSVLTALKVCLQQHNVVPGIKFEALGHNFFT